MGQLTRPEIVDGVLTILGKITGKDQSSWSKDTTLEEIGIGTKSASRDHTLLDLRTCLQKHFGVVLDYGELPQPSRARKTTVGWLIDHIASKYPVMETI